MYQEMGLALFRDLYRLLTIRISKDRFNVKKQRSKEMAGSFPAFFLPIAMTSNKNF